MFTAGEHSTGVPCLVFLLDHMEADADALQAGRTAGVEPRQVGPHHVHLQPRHAVALVVRETLPGVGRRQPGLRSGKVGLV